MNGIPRQELLSSSVMAIKLKIMTKQDHIKNETLFVFLIENLHIIGSPFYFDEFFILVHNLQEKNPGNGMEDTVIHIFIYVYNNI